MSNTEKTERTFTLPEYVVFLISTEDTLVEFHEAEMEDGSEAEFFAYATAFALKAALDNFVPVWEPFSEAFRSMPESHWANVKVRMLQEYTITD